MQIIRGFFYIFFLLFAFPLFCQSGHVSVNGQVTDKNRHPIFNVNILVKGTSKGAQTDNNGNYSILANAQDILVFSYVGMQSQEVVVTEQRQVLDVQLLPKVERLEEVTVKKKKPLTQKELLADYPLNKKLIKTSQGIIDKNRASFSIHILEGKKLMPVGTDFLYSLQNFFPQMSVDRTEMIPKVYLQNWSSGARPAAIFDVDGIIYEQPPTFLMADDIDRVAILLRNGAISRYGPAGTGGVIIINTKSKTQMDDMGIKRDYDNYKLRDSIYSELAKEEVYSASVPNYIKELESATSQMKALAIVRDQKETYTNKTPYYYLEVSKYFRNRWKNVKKANAFLDIFKAKFPKNIKAQKALAYTYEELGLLDEALQIYLNILKLNPRVAQSHRDIANAYRQSGNYQRALTFYSRYGLAVDQLDTIPFDKYGTDILMTTEASSIISSEKGKLELNKVLLQNETDYPNTRFVFEWNDEQAEFDIKIVSPEEHFDLWANNDQSLDTSLQHQKIKGYMSKQFFLNNSLKGIWKVYINYLGNQTELPTYLKVTVYFDYAKSSENQNVKIFKLSREGMYEQIFKVDTRLKKMLF